MPDQDADVRPFELLRRRWREWLPGVATSLALLGIARLAYLAERHHWWFRGHYDLLSLIVFAFSAAGLAVGFQTYLYFIWPPQACQRARRVLTALFFVLVGFKVGVRYAHMCMAGIKLIENLAVFGTPVLAGSIVFLSKGRWQGCLLAAFLLTIIWLLARPYLDWVHGA